MGLRNLLDKVEHYFEKGGRYERWYPLYETMDTFLCRPDNVIHATVHVRDGIDLKHTVIIVWLCTFPAIFFGMYNVDHQANLIFTQSLDLLSAQDDWRLALVGALARFDPNSLQDHLVQGATYPPSAYLVIFIVGDFWEMLSTSIRRHEVSEGFFVTSVLLALTLSPSIPLWQVALGVSLGVVLGKKVFDGTGRNFLNPALISRTFLFFVYPAWMSDDVVWTSMDGFAGVTSLNLAAAGGVDNILGYGLTRMGALLGYMQGSMSETSTLVIFIGGAMLLLTHVASRRIVVGVMLGMVVTSYLFNTIGLVSNPMFAMLWYWHLIAGGFAFDTIFMVVDPVSASTTDTGKWLFGALIGVMVMLIWVINPALPEGTMLTILLANLFAPLINHFVIQADIKWRLAYNS